MKLSRSRCWVPRDRQAWQAENASAASRRWQLPLAAANPKQPSPLSRSLHCRSANPARPRLATASDAQLADTVAARNAAVSPAFRALQVEAQASQPSWGSAQLRTAFQAFACPQRLEEGTQPVLLRRLVLATTQLPRSHGVLAPASRWRVALRLHHNRFGK